MSHTRQPASFTHFRLVSRLRSTLPVQTTPAPSVFPQSFLLGYTTGATAVSQSQRKTSSCFSIHFPTQLEQRPGQAMAGGMCHMRWLIKAAMSAGCVSSVDSLYVKGSLMTDCAGMCAGKANGLVSFLHVKRSAVAS